MVGLWKLPCCACGLPRAPGLLLLGPGKSGRGSQPSLSASLLLLLLLLPLMLPPASPPAAWYPFPLGPASSALLQLSCDGVPATGCVPGTRGA